MNKREYFLSIFKLARKKYDKLDKRLAAEDWEHDWQTLIATLMSAQSRDETTIPIAEKLFSNYPTLKALARAKYDDVLQIFKSLNYNRTKAKHVIEAAKFILKHYDGKIPEDVEKLIKIPGVGRKTANVVRSEVHSSAAIGVDTHVHRISNVLGLVKTKTPHQTEIELVKIIPSKYRSEVNRIFVLWGKHVTGRDKQKFLKDINLGKL